MILQDYETLCKKVTEEEKQQEIKISSDEKQEFINKIKKLNKDEHELLYVIIKKYYMDDLENKNDKLLTQIIPYSGKKLKKNIKFDLEKFPNKLQKILLLFIKQINK